MSKDDLKKIREAEMSGDGPKVIKKAFSSDVRGINEEKRTIDFIISTANLDRYGDKIEVEGWDLRAYKRNPVVLFAHDQWSPPIGKALPSSIKAEGKNLLATAEFATADIYALADTIFKLYKGGFMKATSVGFRPLKWEWVDEGERWGIDFKEQELLEFSCVPVPANGEALVQAKALDIDTKSVTEWCLRELRSKDARGGKLIAGLLDEQAVEDIYNQSRRQFTKSLIMPKAGLITTLNKTKEDKMSKTKAVPADKQDELRKRNADATAAQTARSAALASNKDLAATGKPALLKASLVTDSDVLGKVEIKGLEDLPADRKVGDSFGPVLLSISGETGIVKELEAGTTQAQAEELARDVVVDANIKDFSVHVVDQVTVKEGVLEGRSLVAYSLVKEADEAEDEETKGKKKPVDPEADDMDDGECEAEAEDKGANDGEDENGANGDGNTGTGKKKKKEGEAADEDEAVVAAAEADKDAEPEAAAEKAAPVDRTKMSPVQLAAELLEISDLLVGHKDAGTAFKSERTAVRTAKNLVVALDEIKNLLDTADETAKSAAVEDEAEESLTEEEMADLAKEALPELAKLFTASKVKAAEARVNKERGRLD